jgi:hypothetical protein
MKRFSIFCLTILIACSCRAGGLYPVPFVLTNVGTNVATPSSAVSEIPFTGFVEMIVIDPTNAVASLATNSLAVTVSVSGDSSVRRTIYSASGIVVPTTVYPQAPINTTIGGTTTNSFTKIPIANGKITVSIYNDKTNCNVKAWLFLSLP